MLLPPLNTPGALDLDGHLRRLFPSAYDLPVESFRDEVRAQSAKDVDLAALFGAVGGDVRARNLFNNLFDEAVTERNPSAPSSILFSRVEQHVHSHGLAGVPLDSTKVEDAVLQLHSTRSPDIAHFDRMLRRVVALTQRGCDDATALAGLEASEYWSLMIAGLEPFLGDDGEPEELMRTHPQFLVAVFQHGLVNGLTPDMMVYQTGAAWPQCDRKLEREPFRTALVTRTCASTVCAFDSLVVERRMRERILSGIGKSGVVPPARRHLRMV